MRGDGARTKARAPLLGPRFAHCCRLGESLGQKRMSPSGLSIFDSKAPDVDQHTQLHKLLVTRGHTPTSAMLPLVVKHPESLAGYIPLLAMIQVL